MRRAGPVSLLAAGCAHCKEVSGNRRGREGGRPEDMCVVAIGSATV